MGSSHDHLFRSQYPNLRLADDNLQRYQGLADVGAIAQKDLMQYRTSRDTDQAQVTAAMQGVTPVQ